MKYMAQNLQFSGSQACLHIRRACGTFESPKSGPHSTPVKFPVSGWSKESVFLKLPREFQCTDTFGKHCSGTEANFTEDTRSLALVFSFRCWERNAAFDMENASACNNIITILKLKFYTQEMRDCFQNLPPPKLIN